VGAKATKRGQSDPKRRVPSQARSQRRFEAIVDAAANAFADAGFDASTMEGIAGAAETSIGSVYQFFPNKRAVFREVATKCLARSREKMQELLGANPVAWEWGELLDRVIDGYRELQREPVMRAIWRNLQLYEEFEKEDTAQLREFIEVTTHLLGVWTPSVALARRRIIATTVVNAIVTAMLTLSRSEAEDQDLVIDETKLMLRRYLQGYADA
jgi:AcrR family transcriptional regulator